MGVVYHRNNWGIINNYKRLQKNQKMKKKIICHKIHLADIISMKTVAISAGLIGIAIVATLLYVIISQRKQINSIKGAMTS